MSSAFIRITFRLLTTLKPGELRVLKDGRKLFSRSGEGFVEITGASRFGFDRHGARSVNRSIDGAAEAAVARAQAAMKEDHGAEEVAAIQATLAEGAGAIARQAPRSRSIDVAARFAPLDCSCKRPTALGIIAGNGAYPGLLADSARSAGVKRSSPPLSPAKPILA